MNLLQHMTIDASFTFNNYGWVLDPWCDNTFSKQELETLKRLLSLGYVTCRDKYIYYNVRHQNKQGDLRLIENKFLKDIIYDDIDREFAQHIENIKRYLSNAIVFLNITDGLFLLETEYNRMHQLDEDGLRKIRYDALEKERKFNNLHRSCGIYFLQDYHGFVKIGKAGCLSDRLRAYKTGYAISPIIVAVICNNDIDRLEREHHRKYQKYSFRGEWFNIPPEELASIIGNMSDDEHLCCNQLNYVMGWHQEIIDKYIAIKSQPLILRNSQ